MTSYCTLDEAKTELKATSTVSDDTLRRYIQMVSKRIDAIMGNRFRPYFAPYIETRRRNISALRINSWENSFELDYHILAVSAVVAAGETITSNVELYAPNNEVATMLRITNNYTTWYNVCGSGSDTPPYVLQVTGTWGYHDDYTNAWDSVDTLNGAINATVTSLTVNDIDGANGDNYTPRISAGNLIRINSEFMDVLATNTTTNVATVKRGVNGSTAAAHADTDAVEVYRVPETINRATIRQSALLIARQGAFQVETLDGVGVVSYPQDLLSELKGILTDYQYA